MSTPFRIQSEFTIPTPVDTGKTIKYEISDFRTIYRDRFIELVWNPIVNQLYFKINKNYNNMVRGGYEILNSEQTGVTSFQYEHDYTSAYYFSSSDGKLENINTEYKFIGNWNRAKLWLASVWDKDFPYYDITISSNSNKVIATITKTDVDD